jgi:predicted neutral ceramidase superfamily lipid hydrolase
MHFIVNIEHLLTASGICEIMKAVFIIYFLFIFSFAFLKLEKKSFFIQFSVHTIYFLKINSVCH